MLIFDIPINIRVNAETEEEAEQLVSFAMDKVIDKKIPLLNRSIIEWDFIEFVEGEDEQDYSDESSSF